MPSALVDEGDVAASDHRPEVEGLRAVAVALVVAYHLGATGFAGGWIGVDVFFVISGFVITRTILRDHDAGRSGTGYRLRTFYAARVRRILPAAMVTFLAVLAWIWVHYGALASLWADEATAVVLSISNVFYARNAVPYGSPASPFQHYWSLAVEEQLYVVWPAALVLALSLGRRRWAAAAALVLGAASFAFLWAAAGPRPLDAFYLMPARAWELLAGAGLAFLEPQLRRARGPQAEAAASALGWVALATLAGLVRHVAVPPADLVRSLVPVVAASVLLLGSCLVGGRWSVGRLLGVRPLGAVGRLAYVLYLWHLPVIVALDARSSLPIPRGVAAVGLTTVLAVASHALVEGPLRRLPWLVARPGLTLAGGAAVVALALVATTAVTGPASIDADRRAELSAVPAGDVPLGPLPKGAGSGDLPPDATSFVPSDLTPPLDRAGDLTYGAPSSPACFSRSLSGTLSPKVALRCRIGAADRTRPLLVLYGDSHAWQWWAAFDEIGRSLDVQVALLWRPNCSWVADTGVPGCEAWRRSAARAIRAAGADVVVLASLDAGVAASMDTPAYAAATRRSVAKLPRSASLVVLRDVPHPSFDPSACLARNLTDVRACDFAWTPRTERDLDVRVTRSAAEIDASYVDTQPLVCDTPRCPLIRGSLLVYGDDNHISPAYGAWLAPQLEPLVAPALTGS